MDDDRRLDEMRATYDRIAARYAARFLCRGAGARLDRFLHELDVPGSPGAGVILDVGCGPALDAKDLAAAGRPIVGLDRSPGMLAEARRRSDVPLVQADLLRVPLRAATVAGVWSANVLMHLPPASAATAVVELARVARRGAPLFVSVTAGPDDERRDDGGGHRSFWHHERDPLRRLVEGAGFAVRVCRLDASPSGPWVRLHATRT